MKEIIEAARGEIQALQEQQNQIFEHVVKQVSADEEWLWEYLFNTTNNDDSSYSKMVRDNLFGGG